MNEIRQSPEWNAFLKNPSKENCDMLKNTASNLDLTQRQKSALQEALQTTQALDLFAVRSSSPEEDLKDTSFAGQYETYLGVLKDQVPHYIAQAFSSVFDTRVVEYKRLNGLDIYQPKIALVVQKQIKSDISGIAFSINPNNNCYDEVMINASYGLGEAIVSGIVTPDTY
ncbi:Phosphoenolpyruvate synthase like protein, partial [Aduncisulcus paluster]